MAATVTAIDTTVELAAPTNLLNPPRFSPVVVTPEIVTLSEKAAGSATVNPSRVVAPSTSSVVDTVAPPVTARVDPLNVRFPESSISPDVPAKTTHLKLNHYLCTISN